MISQSKFHAAKLNWKFSAKNKMKRAPKLFIFSTKRMWSIINLHHLKSISELIPLGESRWKQATTESSLGVF